VQALRQSYGLEGSTLSRLWLYLTSLARFDLGWSVTFNRPIAGLIAERLPNTLWLMVGAVGLSFTAGSLLGIVAGSKPGSWRDRLLSTGSLALYAVPSFWLGLVLIVLFSVQLRWFPTSGIETIASGKEGLARARDIAWHLALPVAALGLIYLALFLRMMRAGMAEAWRQDYALAARARGIGPARIAVFHIARNALLPLVTMLGLHAASMLGGSVVIESVFAIPGFGRLAQEAVAGRDAPLLTGIILVSAVLVILVNLAVDMAYAFLDPRVGANEVAA
jgi:peptide/nickel transport system permease protein